jgi:ferredoxin
MRRGRGHQEGARGRRRMQFADRQFRRTRENPVLMTWIVSLLPAIWEAFTAGREKSILKKGFEFFVNRNPVKNEWMLKIEGPAERKMDNNNGLMGKAMEKAAGKLKAHVDKDACSGCGACMSECPNDAIKVSDVAEVDESLCTGCGICVEACPLEALSMK